MGEGVPAVATLAAACHGPPASLSGRALCARAQAPGLERGQGQLVTWTRPKRWVCACSQRRRSGQPVLPLTVTPGTEVFILWLGQYLGVSTPPQGKTKLS